MFVVWMMIVFLWLRDSSLDFQSIIAYFKIEIKIFPRFQNLRKLLAK